MVPFGGGRTVCPGASLAMQLAQSVLGALIHCFEWEVEGGRPVDMTEEGGADNSQGETFAVQASASPELTADELEVPCVLCGKLATTYVN